MSSPQIEGTYATIFINVWKVTCRSLIFICRSTRDIVGRERNYSQEGANMDNNPEQPKWRFDPQTGERIDNSPPAQQPQPQQSPPQPYTPPQQLAPPVGTPQSGGYQTPGAGYGQPQQQPNYAPPQYTGPQQYPQQYQQPYSPPVTQVATARKRSKAPLVVGLIVILLLAAGGASAYFAFNRVLNAPAVAVERILPSNTLAYLTINPNLSGTQKAAFDKMRAAFEAQPGFKEAWAKMTQQASDFGAMSGIAAPGATPGISDFDAISSYLGNNVTIALLPPSTADLQKLKDASSSDSDVQSTAADLLGRNVVGIVDLDFNPLNKKGPLADLKRQTDDLAKSRVAESYGGMDIHEYITGTNTIYFTLLKDTSTAVVGGKIEPVRAMIDSYKAQTGLKDSENFKYLSGQVPTDRVASLYVDLTDIYKEIQTAAPETFSNGMLQSANGAMLMTLSGQDGGLQIDIASQTDLQGAGVTINPDAKPAAGTLNDIPTGSLGFLVGTDLKTALQSVLAALRKQGQASGDNSVDSALQQMEQSTGLNLENDVLPLLGGDYVLSAGADSSSGSPSPSVVFQLKLNPADTARARNVVDKLAASISGGEAAKVDLAGGAFYELSPEIGALYGVANDRLIFVFDKDVEAAKARVGAVSQEAGKGFGSTTEWRDVSKHLPNDSNVIEYMDISGIRALVEESISGDAKQEYEQSAAPFLRPVKYFLVGSATQQAIANSSLSRNHTIVFLGISQ